MKTNIDFVEKYLDLIQVKELNPPSLAYLGHLQSRHLETLAWNTIDVFLGTKVILDPNIILNKFLMERRGGLCYELNGAFCSLLNQLGFDAYLASSFAFAYHEDLFDFPSDTHAVIIVNFNDCKYLVEVGYGALFKNPIKIEDKIQYADQSGEYRLLFLPDIQRFQLERLCNGEWKRQNNFELTPRELNSFTPNLEIVYQHPIYQKLNYIKPTSRGVQILKNDHYIVHHNEHVETLPFKSLGGIQAILKDKLGMSEQFVNAYF